MKITVSSVLKTRKAAFQIAALIAFIICGSWNSVANAAQQETDQGSRFITEIIQEPGAVINNTVTETFDENMPESAGADGAESSMSHSAEEKKKGGLPQMNVTTFPSQIFWLLITFGAMFLLFSSKILPNISEVMERRRETIDSDLETAQTLRDEADAVQDEYQKAIEKARNDAAELLTSLKDDIRADNDAAYNSYKEKTLDQIAETESKVEQYKASMLHEIRQESAVLTQDIVKTVSGMKITKSEAEKVVQSLNEDNVRKAA
jgi:F-type H+-transporting ATPase subunit b